MEGFTNHPLYPHGSPLFISAGIFKEPGQLTPFTGINDPLAAPVLTEGGFTLKKHDGCGGVDFVYYPERGMAGNCRGLPNNGIEGIRALSKVNLRLGEIGIKTIIQLAILPHEDPKSVMPLLIEAALEACPTAIELDLSCPTAQTADARLYTPVCNNPQASAELVSLARRTAGDDVCLGIKDSPHVSALNSEMDEDTIRSLGVLSAPYIDFVTGINTIGNQPFPELTSGNGRGGMSGPVVAPVAKQHLSLWRHYAPDIAYLSCGGVSSENASCEIPERLALGALLVGGAQEFYRSHRPHLLSERWLQ